MMKIHVCNLSLDVTEEELRAEFASFGKVETVSFITNKHNGRPKGFAFVEMLSVSEGQAAIDALNGKILNERILIVTATQPRSDSRGGSYRGRRSGGFERGRGRRY